MPDRVPWRELGPHFLSVWGFPRGQREPEHLEILGQTGSGKSFFEATILRERARARGSHIVVVATKPADKTLAALGWPIIDKWPPNYNDNQVIYWAKAPGLGAEGIARQRAKVAELLDRLWVADSNRIVAFDEVAYIDQDLRLRTALVRYYREGRSLGITVVGSTQRPQGVPRYMHSESAWSVFFSPKDEEDAERMAQVAGSKRLYMPILLDLDRTKFEFLMVRNLTGEKYISHIERTAPKKAAQPTSR
jgi:Helicase HerA, central domain